MKTQKKNTHKILFITLLLINYYFLNAQNNVGNSFYQLNIKTPGVSDFIRHGNIPIFSYTGGVNLQIPLVSGEVINQNPVEVSLAYNSSGFMPNKRSGLVGLNWYLNMGGVITRQIKGVPDDFNGNPTTGTSNGTINRHTNGFIVGVRNYTYSPSAVFNFALGTGFVHSTSAWMFGEPGNNNAYETSPDIFSFNFNGFSGKFFMGNDGQVKVVSNQAANFKVDLSGFSVQRGGSCLPTASEIKITDNQGNQYFFGGTPNNLEYSLFIGNRIYGRVTSSLDPKITSWFLRKIVYANNTQIEFKYRNDTLDSSRSCLGNDIANLKANKDFIALHQYISQERRSNAMVWDSYKDELKNTSFSSGEEISYEFQKKVILDEIKGEAFKITLEYSPQLYKFNTNISNSVFEYEDIKLDRIKLFNHKDVQINKFEFEYEYLGGTNNRMFLKRLTETAKPSYVFNYEISKNLPQSSTKGIDHWSYWNGRDSQISLIPDMNYSEAGDFDYTSLTRNPDFDFSKQGTLTEVIYPTGGKTMFEYEPHNYSKRLERPSSNNYLPQLVAVNAVAGGTRIKKITDYLGDSVPLKSREFKYIKNYNPTSPNNTQSSGILIQWPRYAIHWSYKYGSDVLVSNFMLRSNSINSNSLENAFISYSEVTESVSGNGYTINTFSDYASNPDLNDFVIKKTMPYNESDTRPLELYKNYVGIFYNDTSIERGKLLNTKIYDQSNKLLQETQLEYNRSGNRFNEYTTNIHLTGMWAQATKLYYFNDDLSKKINISYLNGNSISHIEEYQYEPTKNLLTKQKIINGIEEPIETRYLYPHDVAMSNEPFINELKLNKEGVILQKEKYINNEKIEVEKTLYSKDNTTNNLLLPKTIYAATFPNSFPNLPNIGQLEKKFTFNRYDSKARPIEVLLEGGTPSLYVYGYNNLLPIAKIENYSTNNQEALSTILTSCITTSNNGNENELITKLSELRNHFANAMVTTYTHKPLIGISSITDPKGNINYYSYNQNNQLQYIKDNDNNVIQKYCYNYQGQQVNCNLVVETFYNNAITKPYTRNNCATGGIPSTVNYTVAAGTVSSTISVADANIKANALADSLGQTRANAVGTCTFKNQELSQTFVKNNCGLTKQGTPVVYTVPAGTYTSIISQADANAKAQQDINTRGQAYANLNGTCLFVSKAVKKTFTRNNCPIGYTGSNVLFIVAHAAYNSAISQAHADAQAEAYANANGQAYANTNGTCTKVNTGLDKQ